ncbi:MAG: hypothetical protein R2861_03790 [Desulfobacterales bacterium]
MIIELVKETEKPAARVRQTRMRRAWIKAEMDEQKLMDATQQEKLTEPTHHLLGG